MNVADFCARLIGQVEVKEVDSGETNVLLVMTKCKGGEAGMEVASGKKDPLSTDQKIRRDPPAF